MEAKDTIKATQEMIDNGTFHADMDSLALGLTGQLRNSDGKLEFVDREGKATEVKCFDSKFDQEPGAIAIGPSGAGQSFFIDDLKKYDIQTIKDGQ